MMVWLRNANKWQRLWFVLSCLSFFYGFLIFPFVETADSAKYDRFTIYDITEEMTKPECKIFLPLLKTEWVRALSM